MENSRITKFLILIFAVLTLVFYLMYRNEERKSSVLDENFVKEAVLNLKNQGVQVKSDIIKLEIPDRNVYVFKDTGVDEYSEKISSSFAEGFEKEMFTTKLDTPSGFSLAFFDSAQKDVEVGKFHFSSDDFKFVYSAVSNSITPDSAIIYSDVVSLDAEKLEFIERTARSLNVSNNSDFRITGSVNDGEYCIVSVVQTFNDIEYKDVYINFVFDENGLVHAVGSWVTYDMTAQYHEMLSDGVNALYKLKLDNVSEVVSERIVYSLKKGNDSKYFVVPCWEIAFVDKKGVTVKEYIEAF